MFENLAKQEGVEDQKQVIGNLIASSEELRELLTQSQITTTRPAVSPIQKRQLPNTNGDVGEIAKNIFT